MKICRIATVPFFLQNHLRGQIIATVQAGHEVTLVCGDGPEIAQLEKLPGVRIVVIDIPRQISPLRDLRALWALYRFFRKQRFDITHSTTPKAGMLSALAGCLARVPIRLHTFTGQPWVELGGPVRWLAKNGDRLTARCTTRCYADSLSQRDFLVEQKVDSARHLHTLGAGSLAGVDLSRFDPAQWRADRAAVRQRLGIPATVPVITFIGRVTRDKGIAELVAAAATLQQQGRKYMLLLVGPFEPERDPLAPETLARLRDNAHIRTVGYVPDPERILAITDILCLPSYREGFGNVVIEAAAMGVPCIGSDIVGLSDAVRNGQTGLLVPAKDADMLAAALADLLEDAGSRVAMGERARDRVLREFDSVKVNAMMLDEYLRLAADNKEQSPMEQDHHG